MTTGIIASVVLIAIGAIAGVIYMAREKDGEYSGPVSGWDSEEDEEDE